MRFLARVIGDHAIAEISFAFEVAECVTLVLVQRFVAHWFLAHEQMSRFVSFSECRSMQFDSVLVLTFRKSTCRS